MRTEGRGHKQSFKDYLQMHGQGRKKSQKNVKELEEWGHAVLQDWEEDNFQKEVIATSNSE